jgi:hypothetical protein
MPMTGSREQQATETVRPAAPPARPGAPSWGPVLATTVKLWSARRLHRLRHSRRAWLAPICVLAVAAVAMVIVVQTAGTSARAPGPARANASRPLSHSGSARAAAASRIRSQAAAWTASQVSQAEKIACDPSMCTALDAAGVASSRLVSLSPSASGASGADVIVASPSAHPWLSQDAPTLLARVGSGASLIEVRAVSPGGTAAYQASLRADLADRRSAGRQLMHSRRIQVSAQGAAQLAAQHSWQVIAFGDPSPGAPTTEAPYRQVTIAAADPGSGTAVLDAAATLLRAQHAPYLPAHATIVQLAGGRPGLRIDFAAPGLLGLLAGSVTG